MSECVWQNHYLLGNTEVDQQHRQLFQLANRVISLQDFQALINNLMLLYQHVREHFHAEEAFMKQHGYPEYQRHVQMHNLMLQKLVEFSHEINQQKLQQQDLPGFMRGWVTHIVEDDAAINAYIKNRKKQKSDSSITV